MPPSLLPNGASQGRVPTPVPRTPRSPLRARRPTTSRSRPPKRRKRRAPRSQWPATRRVPLRLKPPQPLWQRAKRSPRRTRRLRRLGPSSTPHGSQRRRRPWRRAGRRTWRAQRPTPCERTPSPRNERRRTLCARASRTRSDDWHPCERRRRRRRRRRRQRPSPASRRVVRQRVAPRPSPRRRRRHRMRTRRRRWSGAVLPSYHS